MSAERDVYSGATRRLVIAMDIGTTYSGISYSVLDPGQVPVVKGVTKFPAQETISGASKIPTVIYYDRNGEVRAVGAETNLDGTFEAAEENQWVRAEWFKLHLRSKYGDGIRIAEEIPPLPLNKTVVEVFSDFLKYMLFCAKEYIRTTHANGPQLIAMMESETHFVLSHPNGWEGREQAQMRQAAVLAGLVPDTPAGYERVILVTEGEASLHFAIQDGTLAGALEGGDGVVVVDAGGGTVDVSSYRRNDQAGQMTFEEISVAQCYFSGSVFVNIYARIFLQNLLKGSKYEEDVDHVLQCFDKITKPRFRNAEEAQYVKFGSTRDNDQAIGIRFGQLKLNGSDVALFFQPSITSIVEAVKKARKDAKHVIKHVVLVGGLSASDWLLKQVEEELTPLGLNVTRPESHLNKAVSDGATSFYLDHYVRARVSKMTYGVWGHIIFDPKDPEHCQRESKKVLWCSGTHMVPDAFFLILPKDTQVSETKEFRRSFFQEVTDLNELNLITAAILCYRGENPTPKWKDEDKDNYTNLCTIVTDYSKVPTSLGRRLVNRTSVIYYRVDYEVILLFGLTELKAQLAWKEDGVEKRGPAKLIFDH